MGGRSKELDWLRSRATDSQIQGILDQRNELAEKVQTLTAHVGVLSETLHDLTGDDLSDSLPLSVRRLLQAGRVAWEASIYFESAEYSKHNPYSTMRVRTELAAWEDLKYQEQKQSSE